MKRIILAALLTTILCSLPSSLHATKLISAASVDNQFLRIAFADGEVRFKDDGLGDHAFLAHGNFTGQDTVVRFGAALNTAAAVKPTSWTLRSNDDGSYAGSGVAPLACYRKTKLSAMSEGGWNTQSGWDYIYDYTLDHQIFLKLPHPLKQGKSYTLTMAAALNSDSTSATITFDVFNAVSEAVHVNLVGYAPEAPRKAADVYLWMGDGGARDYSAFESNRVYLYNTQTQQSTAVGTLSFWKEQGNDVGGQNLTMSSVWRADCEQGGAAGRYRLVVEGIGCSQDFTIAPAIYQEPFNVALKGFYYMRIGEPRRATITPVPRQPRWIPQSDPSTTRVYLTSMHPYHAQWKSFSSGDAWDNPNDWAAYKLAGSPQNNLAAGGHSDALDWDRHLGHISIVFDMLLPAIAAQGALKDDAVGIAESGNGVPDILDEAQNEVDFWLRLRDGKGYSHGLTNPNSNNELFQAGTSALAAWANAAAAAMLGEGYRLVGQSVLAARYRDSAVVAYTYAQTLDDQMLDVALDIGNTAMRGRDFKMTAAAYLFNLTGQQKYEDVVKQESRCAQGLGAINDYHWVPDQGEVKGYWTGGDQLWATAGYLLSPQTQSSAQLVANMRTSLLAEAKEKEANGITYRPSRRATDVNSGYFHTLQNMQRTIAAHAVAQSSADKELLLNALYLEADWGLGRNPLNMIQMTTASTPLASLRSVENMYTSGRNDGTPGLHPGHTPYMNVWDWDGSMVMGSPSWMQNKCYPAHFTNSWPRAESYFNTRYVWANAELTPQQTMRGKMALYGYLYALSQKGTTPVADFGSRRGVARDGAAELGTTQPVTVFDIAGRVVGRFATAQQLSQWQHSSAGRSAAGGVWIVQQGASTNRVYAGRVMLGR